MVENGITRPTLVDLDDWPRRHVSAGRLALNVNPKQTPKVEANDAECRPRRVFTTASARPTPAAVKREKSAAIKQSADGNSDGCVMCHRTHELQHCDKFLALTVSEKAEFVGRNRLCFNCLGPDHISATCPSDARCDAEHCGRRHHALLHNGRRVFPRSDNAGGTLSSTKHVGTASVEPRGHILLQVVPITVNGPAGSRTTNALLDLGSQVTLITDDLCDRLGISGPTDKLMLSTLSGSQTMKSRRVSFAVEAVGGDGKAHYIRNAQTTPTLNVSNRVTDCTMAKEKWPHLADLDLLRGIHGPVEALLGTDAIELIVPREVVEGPPGTPCAVKTLLGWTVTGPVPGRSMYEQGEHAVHHVRVSDEKSALLDLQDQVKQFWTTEAFGTKYEKAQLISESDQRALDILSSTTKRAGGRYETGLLWRDDNVQLPDNREAALTRLKAVERRLSRDAILCQSYRETMNSYVTQGHASKVSADEPETGDRTWYLPHHAVTNPNKPGKVRVVFDAAARTAGTSLNEKLISGPNNLNSLTGVLMRFRQGRIPIASDVKQMFHQIAVRAEDRQSQRFLWRDMDVTREPETYQMNVVIFGAKSSPCTATHVLRQCASDGWKRGVDLEPDRFFSPALMRTTRGHPWKLNKPRASSRIRRNMFSVRVVNDWNALPLRVVASTTVNQFKSRLDSHWAQLAFTIPHQD